MLLGSPPVDVFLLPPTVWIRHPPIRTPLGALVSPGAKQDSATPEILPGGGVNMPSARAKVRDWRGIPPSNIHNVILPCTADKECYVFAALLGHIMRYESTLFLKMLSVKTFHSN